MNTAPFELEAPYGFSLSAAADFYAGFAPMGGVARQVERRLELALRLDGTFEAVAATLSQQGARIRVEVEGTREVARLGRQLTRMLGLDVDGRAWAAVGEADPVLGAAQRRFPGFFTAGFPSPYEAGVSGVLSQRSSIRQAAVLRRKLSEVHGTGVGGLQVLPSPEQLLRVKAFPGVPAAKLGVLHGLARAALDGTLDAERLRALPVAFALAQLEQLRGVGPWTAAHLLLRGASLQDALPTQEPRVLRAFVAASGRPEADFPRYAEAWRPFRMWACIALLRSRRRCIRMPRPVQNRRPSPARCRAPGDSQGCPKGVGDAPRNALHAPP